MQVWFKLVGLVRIRSEDRVLIDHAAVEFSARMPIAKEVKDARPAESARH